MKTAAILACVVAMTGAAWGQATPEQSLAFLDRERDGRITRNEYLTFQQSRIAQLDKNGNGVLTLQEFEESLNGRAKARARTIFKQFAAGKRSMDQDHFLGYHAYVFQNFIDTNGDGFADLAEWTKLMQGD